jgi:hypothetical protein
MLVEKHPSTRVTSITEKSLYFMDQLATHSRFRQKVTTVEGFELNPGANGLNLGLILRPTGKANLPKQMIPLSVNT